MRRTMRRIRLIFLIAVAGACGSEEPPDVPSVPDYPTWDEHIQPFVAEHCVLCHGERPRNGAPSEFRLDVYDDVGGKLGARSMAAKMAEVVGRGAMPPDGAGVGPNARAMFRRWAELGAPRSPCTPSCEGRECGDDGCGGSCGVCEEGTCNEAGICVDDEPEAVRVQLVFDQVISLRCISCHGPGEGGLVMGFSAQSFHRAVMGVQSSCGGKVYVVPGDAEASYLVHKVEGRAGICGARMPSSGPRLSDADVDLLRRWIDGGALE